MWHLFASSFAVDQDYEPIAFGFSHATSSYGIHWVSGPDNPVMGGQQPSVIWDGARLEVFYNGDSDAEKAARSRIGQASVDTHEMLLQNVIHSRQVTMSTATKKLQRIGNSTGVVIPADMLKESGLSAGDEVLIASSRGRFEIIALDKDFDAMVSAADSFIADHPNALKKLGE
jgi:putative addiction module antidote